LWLIIIFDKMIDEMSSDDANKNNSNVLGNEAGTFDPQPEIEADDDAESLLENSSDQEKKEEEDEDDDRFVSEDWMFDDEEE